MTAWAAMEALQKAGGTRQLGISNCYSIDVMKQLYADANVKPALVQNRFYQQTGYDRDLRNWCSKNGVIYQSFWTLIANLISYTAIPLKTLPKSIKKPRPKPFFDISTNQLSFLLQEHVLNNI